MVRRRFHRDYKDAMWAATDNGRGHMLWAYCGRGSTGTPEPLLRYSVPLNRWSKSEIAVEALGQARRSRTLDDAGSITSTLSPATSTTRRCGRNLPQTLAVHDGGSAAFRAIP